MENVSKTPEIQGHRGCRGLLPENSLPGFRKALELGADVLELDVVVSGDGKVVVSHEPYLSHLICTGPAGERIAAADERNYNLYRMDYATIRRCDCGSIPHPDFPEQQQVAVHKPLLEEVIAMAEAYCRSNHRPPAHYNVEIKTEPGLDGLFQPEPERFVQLVLDVLQKAGVLQQCNLQSFDVRILQEVRRQCPEARLALLVENDLPMEENLQALGFLPPTYSPDYRLVTPELMEQARSKNMQVVPWTVNEPEDMLRLVKLGVAGLITDYPDRALRIFRP